VMLIYVLDKSIVLCFPALLLIKLRSNSCTCSQKISAKNAFGLHLIDYMSELFKKKEVTDFQVCFTAK